MSVEIAVRARLGKFSLDAAFAIARPGITALFGPSGSGKTSVVNAVAGLLVPREGRVVINGRTVLDTAAGVSVPIRERRVGYVFQDARLFPHMSVASNLFFGWRRAPARAGEAEISEIVEMLALAPLMKRRPGGLSGGEKQRVAIGRALLSAPDLLLLDEPMAGLDAARRAEILPYLERLRARSLPMLYVSHAVDEVARLADEVVVLDAGRIVRQGSVFDVMAEVDPSAGAVLRVSVVRHRDDGLSELSFAGGVLKVQRLRAPEASRLRVRIAAADVMLARNEPGEISANNVLAAKIASLREAGTGLVDVHLLCGETPLVSRITRASSERLRLKAGEDIFAVIKAVTVDAQIAAHGP